MARQLTIAQKMEGVKLVKDGFTATRAAAYLGFSSRSLLNFIKENHPELSSKKLKLETTKRLLEAEQTMTNLLVLN